TSVCPDGGGAGALSELLILERMMYRVRTEQKLNKTPSPCEYFQLIGGSGTGGPPPVPSVYKIIALMLGRLRMSISDTISSYGRLRPQYKLGFAERFKASEFEKGPQRDFQAGTHERCPPSALQNYDFAEIFVCTMNKMNLNAAIPELFRSYDTPYEPAKDYMVWMVARATSATPGLFKHMEMTSSNTLMVNICQK
ncbi:hypothetical protein B0H14DRAFT_2382897, partial [Mycena olivaceomarginata]